MTSSHTRTLFFLKRKEKEFSILKYEKLKKWREGLLYCMAYSRSLTLGSFTIFHLEANDGIRAQVLLMSCLIV
jgi:hypothetical protein